MWPGVQCILLDICPGRGQDSSVGNCIAFYGNIGVAEKIKPYDVFVSITFRLGWFGDCN